MEKVRLRPHCALIGVSSEGSTHSNRKHRITLYIPITPSETGRQAHTRSQVVAIPMTNTPLGRIPLILEQT